MKRTRLGVTAVVLGSLVGSVSAAEWRNAYAPPAAARCDLARGYATAALIAPAARAGRLASEGSVPSMLQASGVSPVVRTRQANLGFDAVMGALGDINGPQTSFPRRPLVER